jgi:hypothetical protein
MGGACIARPSFYWCNLNTVTYNLQCETFHFELKLFYFSQNIPDCPGCLYIAAKITAIFVIKYRFLAP